MSEVNLNQATGRNIPLASEVQRYTFKGAAGYYVYSKDYDAAQSELSTLREELAESGKADHLRQRIAFLTTEIHKQAERLTAAEQRNATLIELLREAATIPYRDNLLGRIHAALAQPTESVSETCTSCDGSGEYIDAIGDWRGYCSCPAGVALKNKPTESGASE